MLNILLPTDFSDNAWNAIKYAVDFYTDTPCNFYVLHTNQITSTSHELMYLPDTSAIQTLAKTSKERLTKVVTQINSLPSKKEHHNTFMLNEYGFLVDVINQQIEEKMIDSIVMGTKGASGLQEVIIGSNTGNVIKKVHCTTLVVPENATYKPIKEIAFPTDFSLFYNIKTLLPLSKMVYDNNAGLRILHISKKKADLDDSQKKNKSLLEDFFAESNFSFHFLTNNKVEDAVQCFVESRDIDLIVMVAKNLNYFQQILFHTKVEKISYHTDVPFLVLHD